MNLRQLRYFVAVAEELHFGRAANRLAISQPPLSQQIMALERELRVQLFTRTRRSVELTPVGSRWLEDVRALLAQADELPVKARRLAKGETGSLSLAFVSTADYGVLPELMSRFRGTHPRIQVRLREATSDVQIDALLNREIDAGLVIPPAGGKFPGSLEYAPLVREKLVLALPASWRMPSGKRAPAQHKLDLKVVADERLIIFPRRVAPAFHDAILDFYASHGLSPVVDQEAVQMQTIVSLISAGMGVALVPASLRNLRRTGVVYRELKGAVPQIETGVLWARQRVSVALRDLLKVAGVAT